MSDNETTEGCLPNPYSVVNGIDDTIENSIFKSKRGKHGPRNEYQWHCSFRDLITSEQYIHGKKCTEIFYQCII